MSTLRRMIGGATVLIAIGLLSRIVTLLALTWREILLYTSVPFICFGVGYGLEYATQKIPTLIATVNSDPDVDADSDADADPDADPDADTSD